MVDAIYQSPDFPSGGFIYGYQGVRDAFEQDVGAWLCAVVPK
jgi:DNA gyrase subunit A (EC 5.99.1.3)